MIQTNIIYTYLKGGGFRISGGTVRLSNSVVLGNAVYYDGTAVYGGGFYITGGIVSLSNSVVSGNSAVSK